MPRGVPASLFVPATQARQMVEGLQVQGDKAAAAEQIKGLYNTFTKCDATMVEVRVVYGYGLHECLPLDGSKLVQGACCGVNIISRGLTSRATPLLTGEPAGRDRRRQADRGGCKDGL